MDEMKIQSKFLTGMISKILERIVKRKFGCRADIRLNAVNVTFTEDGNAHAHLDVYCSVAKDEFTKLLNRAKE